MKRPTATNSVPFRLETFYAGVLHGWGHMVDHRRGGERAMTATLRGDWDGAVLTLDQTWEPDGAPAERRIWRIRPTADGYTGTAPSVVGAATARWDGDTLRWSYQADITVAARTWRLTCEEELALQTDNVAVSQLRISKFGLLIAEVRLIVSRAKPAA
ncbi:MAG: DUF3833 family protein [Alphaproteobacteria bacterium]|nr:DUF3833 family protein [Alphaproteobacteria bacterium]